jgi:hypothetical protein
MARLDRAIQEKMRYCDWLWMAGSEPGHDNGGRTEEIEAAVDALLPLQLLCAPWMIFP